MKRLTHYKRMQWSLEPRGADSGIISTRLPRTSSLHPVVLPRLWIRTAPDLNGKLTDITFTLPIFKMSIVDLTCQLVKAVEYDGNKMVPGDQLKGILGYT